jgi:hypothetical protein
LEAEAFSGLHMFRPKATLKRPTNYWAVNQMIGERITNRIKSFARIMRDVNREFYDCVGSNIGNSYYSTSMALFHSALAPEREELDTKFIYWNEHCPYVLAWPKNKVWVSCGQVNCELLQQKVLVNAIATPHDRVYFKGVINYEDHPDSFEYVDLYCVSMKNSSFVGVLIAPLESLDFFVPDNFYSNIDASFSDANK